MFVQNTSCLLIYAQERACCWCIVIQSWLWRPSACVHAYIRMYMHGSSQTCRNVCLNARDAPAKRATTQGSRIMIACMYVRIHHFTLTPPDQWALLPRILLCMFTALCLCFCQARLRPTVVVGETFTRQVLANQNDSRAFCLDV